MIRPFNKLTSSSNIKDKIRNSKKEKQDKLNDASLGEIKKIEKEAIDEFSNFLYEWCLKYPEIVRVGLYSPDHSLMSFRTDECDEIGIQLTFNLGIKSI